MVNVWSLNGTTAKRLVSIPVEGGSPRILASVDSDGRKCIIFKGGSFFFQVYTLETMN
jgi:hypothetical protein